MGLLRRAFTSNKGTLDLDVANRLYNLGDPVDGTVTLTAKQDLGPGRFFASLVCIEDVRSTRTDSRGRRVTRTERQERWRTEVDLGVDESFSAGTIETRMFTLRLPFEATSKTPHPDTPEWAVGAIAVFDALSDRRRRFFWEVGVRYDILRIALTDEARISVNDYEQL